MLGFESLYPPQNEFYSNFSRVYLRSSTKLLLFAFLKGVIVMCKSQYKNAQKVENKNVQKSDCVYVDSDISESIFILSFKRYELPFILIICE